MNSLFSVGCTFVNTKVSNETSKKIILGGSIGSTFDTITVDKGLNKKEEILSKQTCTIPSNPNTTYQEHTNHNTQNLEDITKQYVENVLDLFRKNCNLDNELIGSVEEEAIISVLDENDTDKILKLMENFYSVDNQEQEYLKTQVFVLLNKCKSGHDFQLAVKICDKLDNLKKIQAESSMSTNVQIQSGDIEYADVNTYRIFGTFFSKNRMFKPGFASVVVVHYSTAQRKIVYEYGSVYNAPIYIGSNSNTDHVKRYVDNETGKIFYGTNIDRQLWSLVFKNLELIRNNIPTDTNWATFIKNLDTTEYDITNLPDNLSSIIEKYGKMY